MGRDHYLLPHGTLKLRVWETKSARLVKQIQSVLAKMSKANRDSRSLENSAVISLGLTLGWKMEPLKLMIQGRVSTGTTGHNIDTDLVMQDELTAV